MTREEAIYRLKNMAWLYGSAEREQNIEAVDMAIEALSAETPTIQEKHQLSEETPTVFIDGIGHFPKLTETSQNLTEPNNTCEVDLISRADVLEGLKHLWIQKRIRTRAERRNGRDNQEDT